MRPDLNETEKETLMNEIVEGIKNVVKVTKIIKHPDDPAFQIRHYYTMFMKNGWAFSVYYQKHHNIDDEYLGEVLQSEFDFMNIGFDVDKDGLPVFTKPRSMPIKVEAEIRRVNDVLTECINRWELDPFL
jgi:hypothetical protein